MHSETNLEPAKIFWQRLLLVMLWATIIRIIPILLGTMLQDDMILYGIQGNCVLSHQNIYTVTHRVFPYAPVSMFIPALCMALSNFLNIPFEIVMKMPALVGDVAIAACLYAVMAKKKVANAFGWATLYTLNPLSILITSFQGNFMTLTVLFTLLAYVVLLSGAAKNYRLSALLLGVAIGLRGYPILLLPLFLIKLPLGLTKKLSYAAHAILPTALSFLPFLVADCHAIFREVFGYSGVSDFSFFGAFRTAYMISQQAFLYDVPLLMPIAVTKVLFFLVYALIVWYCRKIQLIYAVLLSFFAFYLVYWGVAAQYLIWPLPFAFLLKDKFVFVYLLVASAAAIFFYWLFHPHILFGVFPVVVIPLQKLLWLELIPLCLLWVACGVWVALILKNIGNREPALL